MVVVLLPSAWWFKVRSLRLLPSSPFSLLATTPGHSRSLINKFGKSYAWRRCCLSVADIHTSNPRIWQQH